jgi:hypothetical protein
MPVALNFTTRNATAFGLEIKERADLFIRVDVRDAILVHAQHA